MPLVVKVEDTETGVCRSYVFDRASVLIGRSEGMHLRLVRPYVSQAHGIFRVVGDGVLYKDLGSHNGTTIDGSAVKGAADITECSIMRIGPLRLTFSRDPGAQPGHDVPDPFVRSAVMSPIAGPPTAPLRAPTHPTQRNSSGAPPGNRQLVPPTLVLSPVSLDPKRPPVRPAGPVPLARPPSMVRPSPIAPPPTAPLDTRPKAWDPKALDRVVASLHPETPTADDATLSPGTRLGKYELAELLGRGAMGSVYRAVHTGIGKDVAVKVLAAEFAADPEAQTRFIREAASACMLRHPHVVDVTDFGTDRGISYLVMEYLEGRDLATVLAEETLSVERTADILLAVCAAVTAAHVVGIVHRDLKPQNIFLAKTALGEIVPKVLDFGISRSPETAISPRITITGTVMGTPHYMPAEQLGGKPADQFSDQYALGVILYECLTGRRPFEAPSLQALVRAIAAGEFPRPARLRPNLSPGLEQVILRAMAPQAAERFGSVFEFGRALVTYASAKRRPIWEDYFGRERAPHEEVRAAVPLSASPPRSGGSAYVPLAGRTKLLNPFPEGKSETRGASPTPTPRRSRFTPTIVAAAALGLAALLLAGLALLGREKGRGRPAAAPPAAAAPAAAEREPLEAFEAEPPRVAPASTVAPTAPTPIAARAEPSSRQRREGRNGVVRIGERGRSSR
jgi:eukaryotic-like serine/threonine-protein kinase